jgi:cytidylate kinase
LANKKYQRVSAIIIAIDGHSSCGKSTLARAMAARLGYGYVDTGAMYRAAALYFMRNGIALDDEARIQQALGAMHIHFEHKETGNRTFLNGEDVEDVIRSMEVSRLVSPVAAISSVRSHMVRLQQRMGENKGVVMDGRDIGTVVFPKAELKIFLTADTETRVQRRLLELQAKGGDLNAEQVRQNLLERDHIDSTREDSPLRQADDAIVIDNTNLSPEEQLELALRFASYEL